MLHLIHSPAGEHLGPPYLGYCKQCCYLNTGLQESFELEVLFFSDMWAGVEVAGSYVLHFSSVGQSLGGACPQLQAVGRASFQSGPGDWRAFLQK